MLSTSFPFANKRIPTFILLVLVSSITLIMSTAVTTASGTYEQKRLFAQRYWTSDWNDFEAPTTMLCQRKLAMSCYSPQDMRMAYNLDSLVNRSYDGKGQNIVIIASYGSPTAQADLQRFDADYGLPDPPSFQQIAPYGSVTFNPDDEEQVKWAEETSLDIQWAHAMAPGAGIIVLTSAVDETQGIQGMPEFLALEKYALEHHLGNIISQSWSTTENTLFTPDGSKVLNDFENFFRDAATQHITVLASAGDSGSENVDVNGNTYTFPTVGYPASSPWVTAVGGTTLHMDTNSNYQYETVWNSGPGSATGGGISQYFPEPDYQRSSLHQSTQQLLNGHRGVPDVAMNADPNTAVPVYIGFKASPGYELTGGTSESAPLWAGLIADANQFAGHPLGFLNPTLYHLGSDTQNAAKVFHDITMGNNTQGIVPGYHATPGWDAVTGWGSPNAEPLIQALSASTQ
ncbi:MAG TPA: S53 family peptidase [Dictyobacter sp.]|jgi:subtilase family serine protease|nr:S53 family peptidase [Dictyobacter sp.]